KAYRPSDLGRSRGVFARSVATDRWQFRQPGRLWFLSPRPEQMTLLLRHYLGPYVVPAAIGCDHRGPQVLAATAESDLAVAGESNGEGSGRREDARPVQPGLFHPRDVELQRRRRRPVRQSGEPVGRLHDAARRAGWADERPAGRRRVPRPENRSAAVSEPGSTGSGAAGCRERRGE